MSVMAMQNVRLVDDGSDQICRLLLRLENAAQLHVEITDAMPLPCAGQAAPATGRPSLGAANSIGHKAC